MMTTWHPGIVATVVIRKIVTLSVPVFHFGANASMTSALNAWSKLPRESGVTLRSKLTIKVEKRVATARSKGIARLRKLKRLWPNKSTGMGLPLAILPDSLNIADIMIIAEAGN